MKMSTDVAIVIGIFILVIILSLVLSTGTVFVPYSPNTIFPKYGQFEGFHEGIQLKKQTTVSNSGNDNSGNDNSGNHVITPFSNKESFDNRVFSPQTIANSTENCSKIYGFDGLYCSPNNADSKIDKFSDVNGNGQCLNSSSGLSNSKGYLCLGPELIKTLQTRGGNASGIDSQIGQR